MFCSAEASRSFSIPAKETSHLVTRDLIALTIKIEIRQGDAILVDPHGFWHFLLRLFLCEREQHLLFPVGISDARG